MSLEKQIQEDLNTAQKNKDSVTVSTLRLLKSAFQYALIQSKTEQLTDEDILQLIRKQVKQRHDSIDSYARGGRDDLLKKEEAELAILEAYLPKQLPDEELLSIIKNVISDTGAQSKKEMGTVIKQVMLKTQGAADGKRISQMVGNLLT